MDNNTQQPVAYVLAKQTAVEVPGQERKELGYTLFDGIGVFHTREEVHAAIAELGLPIGWVSMTVDQLLPGYMMPVDSPPAPVAPVLPEREVMRDLIAEVIGGDTYDCTRVWSAWGVGTMSEDDFVPVIEQEERLYELADACIDKVKELNQ